MKNIQFILVGILVALSACAPNVQVDAIGMTEPVADVASAPAPPNEEVLQRADCTTIQPDVGDGIGGTGCAQD